MYGGQGSRSPRVGHEQGDTELAVPKLHYGGQEYLLDEAEAEVFLMEVSRALKSGGDIQMVEASLHNGGSVVIAVSPAIPIAVRRAGSGSGKAAFVL
jgi:hypothetical protein